MRPPSQTSQNLQKILKNLKKVIHNKLAFDIFQVVPNFANVLTTVKSEITKRRVAPAFLLRFYEKKIEVRSNTELSQPYCAFLQKRNFVGIKHKRVK